MFAPFMINAWFAGTFVAIASGVTGFFVVSRGRTFAAHAIPNGAFAGAAGAELVGVSPLIGLLGFSVLSAFGITALSRRSRSDVATALWLVSMLALGAGFLSLSPAYQGSLNALLFGDVLGVSRVQVVVTVVVAVASVLGVSVLARPLLLSATSSELAEVRGVREGRLELAFLLVVAISAAMTVPVVGALLVFSLLVSPAAAASLVARAPLSGALWSVALALATIWASIASSYAWGWPVGFFVGTYGLALYVLARLARARFS